MVYSKVNGDSGEPFPLVILTSNFRYTAECVGNIFPGTAGTMFPIPFIILYKITITSFQAFVYEKLDCSTNTQ